MTILTRYIAGQTLAALVLILASLTADVWIAVALRQLRVVSATSQDAWTFLALTTLSVPNLLGLVAPIALLIAALHVLNRLNGDSELIIVTASSGSVLRVLKPLLAIGVVVAVGVLLVNLYAMPYSLREARNLLIEIRTNLVQQMLQPGQFVEAIDGVTVHVRERSVSGELKGILIHDTRKANETSSLAAETGSVVKSDGAPYLLLGEGHIIRQSGGTDTSQIIAFSQYPVELDNFERKENVDYSWKPRERYLGELLYPDADDPRYQREVGKFRAEIHERLSNPLYALAFILIAVASIGQAQSTRSNRSRALVFGFVAAAVLRVIGLTANKVAVAEAWASLLLYAVPILGGVIAFVAIMNNARPRPRPAWRRNLDDRFVAAGAAIQRRLSRKPRTAEA
ncbi:MAG: LptF/LptG family permease [Pseudomonadota bacterium]